VRLIESTVEASLEGIGFWRQALRRSWRKASKARRPIWLALEGLEPRWLPFGTLHNTGIAVYAGQTFTDVVATEASGSHAVINWGDETEEGSTDMLGGGLAFSGTSLVGTHTYSEPGYYPLGIATLNDENSVVDVGEGLAIVLDSVSHTQFQVLTSDPVPGFSVSESVALMHASSAPTSFDFTTGSYSANDSVTTTLTDSSLSSNSGSTSTTAESMTSSVNDTSGAFSSSGTESDSSSSTFGASNQTDASGGTAQGTSTGTTTASGNWLTGSESSQESGSETSTQTSYDSNGVLTFTSSPTASNGFSTTQTENLDSGAMTSWTSASGTSTSVATNTDVDTDSSTMTASFSSMTSVAGNFLTEHYTTTFTESTSWSTASHHDVNQTSTDTGTSQGSDTVTDSLTQSVGAQRGRSSF